MKKLSFVCFIAAAVLLLNTHYALAQNINTVAGSEFPGYFGDGGPATASGLDVPFGIALDNSGNYYIADEFNNVIRRVNTSGIITTVAGSGFGAGGFGGGYSGDGAAATAAELRFPDGVAVDATGNIYFADGANNVIRKVNTSGIISTVAGNGFGAGLSTGGYTGNGGPATLAELFNPAGIAVDNAGNLFIADRSNNCIRKVNTTGTISTVAGDNVLGYTGDGGQATAAKLDGPTGVAVDNSGNIYIADEANNVIRKVNTAGTISTIVGNGLGAGLGFGGYTGDGGAAALAELSGPSAVSVDASGNVFITDQANDVVRKVNSSGIISTFAGDGFAGFFGDGGPATMAALNNPHGVAVDFFGAVYIADAGNSVIRKVSSILGTSGLCSGQTTTLTDMSTGGTWSSSNAVVATINSATGLVTAVSAGVTTISYTLSGHTATAIFTVALPPAAIAGALSLCSGAVTVLSDAVTGGSWSSSMPFVANIDPFFGTVFGESVGTSEITYSTSPGCFVAVSVNVLPGASPISGFPEICLGTPTSFFGGTPGGTWTSSNTAIAVVGASTGFVTGVSVGSSLIVYTLSSGCTDSEMVEVNLPPTAGVITGAAVVCVGSTVTLSDTALGGFWNTASGGSVANVDFETGEVMGVSSGPDIISYVIDNVCGEAATTIAFTVDGFPDAGTVSGADSVCIGSSVMLTDDGASGTWNSGSATIATVTGSGTVFGAAAGVVDIFYEVANSCGASDAVFSISVLSDAGCVGLSANQVNKPGSGQLMVFPNPSDGTFSINILSGIDEQAHVVMTNVVGEKVMEFTIPANKIVPLSIQPLPGSGIYMLSASAGSGTYIAKVIVE